MRKIIVIVLSAFLVFAYQSCAKAPSTARESPAVAATIFPLCDIARNIGGDKIDVIEILPAGASPHTYALAPRQVRQLEGVKVVFSVGHGLDDWTNSILDALPAVKRVVVDKGVHLKEYASQGEHEGEHTQTEAEHHHHEGANPHYWLSIDNGKIIARNIADEVMQLDPANADYYRTNLDTYLSKLDAAKQGIEARIRELPSKKMIAFHDAWFYYADEFGLEIVGTFEPSPGKQPTPRYLAELHKKARSHNVKAVFSEPQLSNETIAAFVGDIGLKLHVLDPLGGVEGRNSYIELFNYNTDIITGALSDERR